MDTYVYQDCTAPFIQTCFNKCKKKYVIIIMARITCKMNGIIRMHVLILIIALVHTR